MSRIEWLKVQLRYGRLVKLPFNLQRFVAFEIYYQFCALRGYRPRHAFLEPLPEGLRNRPPGQKSILLIWDWLPISIRVLEVVCPYANGSHAEFVDYTPEAEAAARSSGKRTAVVKVKECEIYLSFT
jgi:hypothetical protein